MQTQNYKNHPRFVPAYHFLLSLILIVCLVASLWNMYRAYENHSGRLIAAIVFGLSIAFLIVAWYARTFATVAQDRAIRVEENLRHFILNGRPLDSRLTTPQVVALRFAEDTEFLILAEKAANENMKPNEIKKSIINWRADNHRV
jgi:hypothetical protein